MMNNELILNEAKELESYVVETRRTIHGFAEISGHEFKTRELIEGELKKAGIPFKEIPTTGVIGILDTGRPGPHIALRADMDALPMPEEESNLAHPRVCRSSTPDKTCHGCGHDAHTAMLLGSVKALARNKDQLTGIIYFCFEEGEENDGGIDAMMEGLNEYQIDTVWGMHVYSAMDSGTICVQGGPRMAGSYVFSFDFIGKGGHGSRPDQAINPVYCATNWYNNIAVAFANQIDANETVTLGLTSIQGGEVANVIPDKATVLGTFRYFSVKEGEKAARILHETAEHTAAMHHCTVDFSRLRPLGTPVINDYKCSELIETGLQGILPEGSVIKCAPWYASESMRKYLDRYPGVFAFLGIKNEEYGSGAPHHNSFFDVDENVLKTGMIATLKYVAEIEEKGVPSKK